MWSDGLDGMVEQRAAVDRFRELVAPETTGPAAGKHDRGHPTFIHRASRPMGTGAERARGPGT